MTRTLGQCLLEAQTTGIERLDAQRLLLLALGRPPGERAWLLAHDDDPIEKLARQAFQHLCQRRLCNEPMAYLMGHQEFFGLHFKVDARVLVPRPDTETLVQWVLDSLPTVTTPIRLLDLGTGSGAVALAVANHVKKAGLPAHVVAVDASSDALDVARFNARALGLEAEVEFVGSNWFERVEGRFDIIASNPPYIASHDPHLEALRHEPLPALTSGVDGLDDIRRIVQTAPHYLQTGGWLLLEHGFDQATEVCQLLALRGFISVHSRADLAGRLRCSGGQMAG
ncbi:MAG: [protein release factor]-glutamine N5-methyltransferase [Polaromonas sp.]|jgi:release factor glutamine methyltransferase|nr:[protein release factor]-glutamine N5-methyltransferase [Polaromonas sp.]